MKGFNFSGLMKQAQEMQKRMNEIQQSLKNRVVEASSGGGMVKVMVNGEKEVVSIKIDPEVVNPDDVQMLEDLILAAISEGMRKAQEMIDEEMAKLTGGIKLPFKF